MSKISNLANDYLDYVTDEARQARIRRLIQRANDNADNADNDEFNSDENDKAIIQIFLEEHHKIREEYLKIKNPGLLQQMMSVFYINSAKHRKIELDDTLNALSNLGRFRSKAFFILGQEIEAHNYSQPILSKQNNNKIYGNILSNLSMRDARSLRSTCTQFAYASFFRSISLPIATRNRWVTEADYDTAYKLIETYPDLNWMFEKASFEIEGKIRFLSPVQFACSVYDVLMCRIFLAAIVAKKPDESAPLLERFNKHINTAIFYINPELLIGPSGAYATFNNERNLWRCSQISDEEFNTSWLALGKAQTKYLPRHVLKVFCDPSIYWGSDSEFNIRLRPRSVSMVRAIYGVYDSIVALNFADLGLKWTLMRGYTSTALALGTPRLGHDFVRSEATILRHLFKVRATDLENLKIDVQELMAQYDSSPEKRADLLPPTFQM